MFLPNDLGSFSMRIFKKVGWLKCISNIGLGKVATQLFLKAKNSTSVEN